METIVPVAFEYGFVLAGAFGLVGFLIGSLMNLFNDYGRG